ncbi:hypothetical protein CEUSTIGMA_g4697.t1 [Chlamydomonas eustigma]|uniref:Uncharacterized protein n=1 Tax=Chlamydomonas eustigma TaxID=1157962 RepID=A0A250X2F8_9CHLO|nr:hypothetical protein CEUSTIGMA_g4697.t1 [Chlamydomonas eustigma]|eukprot:GAX77251.1 hypothetical protein CEUSTIGMA_g4697.t1 [Chlamydomonas eustigma]
MCAYMSQRQTLTQWGNHRRSGLRFQQSRRNSHLLNCVNVGLVENAILELIDAGTESGHNRVEHSKVQMQIDNLERISAEVGVNRLNASLNQGSFEGLLTTDLRQIDAESNTTLGRLTFGKAAPQNLEVQLNDNEGKALTGLPDQLKGTFEGTADSYVVNAHFKILQPKRDNAVEEPAVHGVMSMIGKYEISGEDKPQRLDISFSKVRLKPADPAHQLDAWIGLLGPHNTDMCAPLNMGHTTCYRKYQELDELSYRGKKMGSLRFHLHLLLKDFWTTWS